MKMHIFYLVIISLLILLLIKRHILNLLKYRKENIWFYSISSLLILSICIAVLFMTLRANVSDTLKSIIIQIELGIFGFIFAIFIGYYAFAQLIENRKERLKIESLRHFRAKEYSSAIQQMEKIRRIDSKDKVNLSDLSEVYTLSGDHLKGEDFANKFEKFIETDEDKLVFFYLKILSRLRGRPVSDTKSIIMELLKFVESHREISLEGGWSFRELVGSSFFKKEITPEQKLILENLMKILTNSISIEDVKKNLNSIINLNN